MLRRRWAGERLGFGQLLRESARYDGVAARRGMPHVVRASAPEEKTPSVRCCRRGSSACRQNTPESRQQRANASAGRKG